MALREDIGKGAKRLGIPAAASLAGAGAGLVLTRKSSRDSVRKAMPDLGDLGSLADDLKTKLESVVGKAQPSGDGEQRASSTKSSAGSIDPGELDKRLKEREQRRKARRSRS